MKTDMCRALFSLFISSVPFRFCSHNISLNEFNYKESFAEDIFFLADFTDFKFESVSKTGIVLLGIA